jgi:ABC-2 type transport system ATP-binding protein
MALIEAESLSKVFLTNVAEPGLAGAFRALFFPRRTRRVAVDGLSLSVEAGEIVGCLGPNGAGKSTTIKLLTGVLHPTSGTVRIRGRSPHTHRERVVGELGVVFAHRTQLYWDLAVAESFELLRRVYGVPAERHAKTLKWLSEILQLDQFIRTPVRQLSLGQRMRAELAAANLHEPSILFLDEPSIGLDVEAKHQMRAFIETVNRERGTTVILTTHDLVDVERLCRRLLVIDHGRIVEDAPLEALVDKLAPHRELVIVCDSDVERVSHPKAEVIRREGRQVWLRFQRSQISASDLIRDLSREHEIRDLTVREADIEDVVKKLYAKVNGGER